MLTQPNIRYLTDIYFEFGSLSVLPSILKKYSVRKPLIVTDKGLTSIGMIKKLSVDNAIIYDDVETNPTEAMAIAARNVFVQMNCDCIIAFGGGSPMDLAKCVGLLVHHKGSLEEYSLVYGNSAAITGNIAPLIAIPTTAGSGSEVGRAALITLKDGRKVAIISDHLLPKATICDPELTIGLPPLLTAATGMDAISHCVECFCSTRINPVADAISLDGLRRGVNNILIASNEGSRNARTEMMMCSLEGGLSFQKGLGAVHSLSHPLGGITAKKLHHGTLNAIFLPHVLKFNFEYCIEKMETIARVLQLSDVSLVPDVFENLVRDIGLPVRLRDLGVTEDDLEPLPGMAMKDHCTATNPRSLNAEEFRKLYFDAL